jgi:hypothetical protein
VSADRIDGISVQLTNRGQLVLPTTVEATFKDGTTERVRLPVETWLSRTTFTWTPQKRAPIARVTVDPDHQLPDDDRRNNTISAE